MDSLKVQILGVYKTSKGFMVALESEAGGKILPIFISEGQAQSIGLGLSEKEPSRPLTHDLLLQIIGGQDLTVESVTVDGLQKGTFTAELRLTRGDKAFPYDLRPSDAIALAVRKDVDIYVSRDVMERAGKEKKDQVDDSRKLALKRFKKQEEE
ncbi:hypothetical protein AKJ52_01850 [candidate division MSBL1 archaeon SCGC-AAA382C18]|uniref:BFN domain-containing protein n=1 Tax=candidate division MSBL1 archaeon SCGC-AAA382C18 TaxID=1698281 RepID=A0A133VJQ1_9EURY|nr:hypothetical protein AKJ52_01850 [candidate division MSBL1 archaeon SCGC-AAA382C18]